jgi:CRP/FNR family transcriptional regulator
MGIGHACQKCAIRQRALCGAMSDASLTRLVHRRRAPSGNLILDGEHDPGWVGVILSGVVKLLKTAADGRRQIVGLQFPGQFVGRPGGKPSPFLAEAASDVDLCCFAGTSFEAVMRENRDLEQVVMQQTQDELDLAREWMFVLGRKTAQEKVASLLLLMAHHLSRAPGPHQTEDKAVEFELPLSRTEMAEYLGLTIETVSRQISNLKAHAVIAMKGARVVTVSNLATLQDWSERNQG